MAKHKCFVCGGECNPDLFLCEECFDRLPMSDEQRQAVKEATDKERYG